MFKTPSSHKYFMKNLILFLSAYWAAINLCLSQSLFERLPEQPEHLSVLLLGYHTNINNRVGFGSASLFFAPIAINKDSAKWICAVTALHCLKDLETGQPFDGVILKINMPPDKKPRYIKMPLKNDDPKNYWVSPSGLDLAVIPLPPEVIDGADVKTFSEDLIVTPATVNEAGIAPGLLTEVICLQPEYFEFPLDYTRPETRPIVRLGHLSRLGFCQDSTGFQIRSHVIDVHGSPGNSGAAVVVFVPRKDNTVADLMFLGIVGNFREELGSYTPYQILMTNAMSRESGLELVSAQDITNRMGIAIKTKANPNLTDVIPVQELVGLRDSKEFQAALRMMVQNRQQYVITNWQ
jgi:hypothetical protein